MTLYNGEHHYLFIIFMLVFLVGYTSVMASVTLSYRHNFLTNISSSSGISDHDIVSFDLSVSPKIHRKPPRKIWQYRKSDTKSLEKYLTEFAETFIHGNVGGG